MKLRPGNHVYAETDSAEHAQQVRRALEEATGHSYTITPGVNRIFAVRKLVPDWDVSFLRWRDAFYREFGVRP